MRRVVFLFAVVAWLSCKNQSEPTAYDSVIKGRINISVDESFKPVIEEQIKVFQSSYKEASVKAAYKAEVECFKDLQTDSTRMIIVARNLTAAEKKFFKNINGFAPVEGLLARDAVAVVINKASADSFFSFNELYRLLTEDNPLKQVVVDGNNATSTVRFLMDSVLKGARFSKQVVAAGSSEAVVDFVSRNANAVGFVGISWVGNEDDPEQARYLETVKFAMLPCRSCKDSALYVKPSQNTIMFKKYPFVREVYYILNENRTGLGTGFAGFMTLERGQLIFRRSNLVPAIMNFQIRSGKIETD